MMIRAQVLTPWSNNRRALVLEVFGHPAIQGCMDVTGQPANSITPDVNLFAVEITCEQATLDAIEADARFVVVWSEDAEEA